MTASHPTQDQVANSPSVEQQWINWIRSLSDPIPALRAFARHYHYFSLNQVVAFSRLLGVIPPTDRKSMAVLGEVLFEELGGGEFDSVHSIVFERFAKRVGLNVDELPLTPSEVAKGVRWYVCELESAFGGRSLARALATYCFLESSAVETYGPLLEALRAHRFSEDDLKFFVLHSQIEIEHSKAAHQLAEQANLSAADKIQFDDQTRLLTKCWRAFWEDIWEVCRKAYI